MIVLYCLISIILISILLITVIIISSSITVEVKRFKIDDIKNITTIINDAIKSQYVDILNNMDILVKLKLNIFSILPITVLKIDNKKIKRMISKTKKQKPTNFYKKEKLKFIGKKIINKYLKIDNIDINISLGMYNAYITAISSTLLMIALSIMINYITEDRIKKFKSEKKQYKYIERKFVYKVDPVYKDELVLKIELRLRITIQILSIIKEVLMYKSNLFVNNTNKYKVKES